MIATKTRNYIYENETQIWECLALRRREKFWHCLISRASRSKRRLWKISKKMSKTNSSGQHFQPSLSLRKFSTTAPVAWLYSDLGILSPVIFSVATIRKLRINDTFLKLHMRQIIHWQELIKWEKNYFFGSQSIWGAGQLVPLFDLFPSENFWNNKFNQI